MGFENLPKTTADLAQEQMAKLRALFPECVTEGPAGLAVDFDLLRRALSSEAVVEGPRERYRLEWPGKRAARYAANAPTASTLRPVRERSKDFDTTQNLYIEGDNLEALKLLRTAYSGKVKLIYIDPPYNTGHDFIYHDKYVRSVREEQAKAGLLDDAGRQTEDKDPFRRNDETNGRYHSDWLTMMYPRLLLARDLLADDGVIFISIDDNEQANLKRLCDEIFGAGNFIGQWNWYKSATPPNLSRKIKKNIEYILCYERQLSSDKYRGVKKYSASSNGLLNQTNRFATLMFPANIVRTGLKDGIYKAGEYGTPSYQIVLLNDVEVKNGLFVQEFKLQAKFKWGQEKLFQEIRDGTTLEIRTEAFSPSYERKEYDPEVPPNFINKGVGVDTTEQAGKLLDSLFDGAHVFDYPKPVNLICYLANFICKKDDLILDFFSGSGTTAHAVMQLNAEDGGNRKFILVQLPEKAELGSAAAEAGFADICTIGEERIRRAGEAILGAHPELRGKLDVGFRVLRLDEKNEVQAAQTPDDALTNWALALQEETIKEGRTEEDLLFQALLRVTEPLLVEKIERAEVDGLTVWSVADGFVVACLAGEGQLTAAKAVAVTRWIMGQTVTPSYVAFRESGFANDEVKANVEAGLRQAGCQATLWVL